MAGEYARHRQIFGLLALLLLAAGSARTEAAQVTDGEARWIVDWAEQRCTLSRQVPGRGQAAIALTSPMGTERPQLIFLHTARDFGSLGHRSGVDIVLLPQGERLAGRVNRRYRVPGERALVVDVDDQELVEKFIHSRAVAVERNGRRLATVDYPDPRQAVDVLIACNDDLLSSWGIDPAARRALSRLPRSPDPAGWIDSNDYPAAAMRIGEQGSVVVRLDITDEGRVSECAVVASSGSDMLDRRTCAIYERRVQFEPALDAEGNPAAASIASRITWYLGD